MQICLQRKIHTLSEIQMHRYRYKATDTSASCLHRSHYLTATTGGNCLCFSFHLFCYRFGFFLSSARGGGKQKTKSFIHSMLVIDTCDTQMYLADAAANGSTWLCFALLCFLALHMLMAQRLMHLPTPLASFKSRHQS